MGDIGFVGDLGERFKDPNPSLRGSVFVIVTVNGLDTSIGSVS